MFRKVVYLNLILIFTTSCTMAPTPVNLQTNVPEPTMVFISPTAIDHSVVETVEPNNERICPTGADVPINELELPNNSILLAVSDNEVLGGNLGTPLSSDIFGFSGASSIPKKIEGIRSLDGDSKIINILISPDGLWLAILRWNAIKNHETLWISTLDGQEQRMIADISPKQKVSWVGDSEILVVGVPNETDYEGRIPEEAMRPLISINPFTLDARNLEQLPEGTIYINNSYHSINGNPYSIYYKDDNQKRAYFLYDYVMRTSTQIFRWIDTSDTTTGVGIRPNGLYSVERGVNSGVDFALDLNIGQISEDQEYNDVMKHLSIEGLEITSMFSNLTQSDILILTSDPLDYDKPTPMYLFDHKANNLKDYCINLGLVSTVFSPDERFVAFTIYEGIDSPGYHVLLLNLKTGYYSIISDMEAIGFGVMN